MTVIAPVDAVIVASAADQASLPPLILVFVPHTVLPGSRSGVQRLVVSSVTELAGLADIELVTWDDVDGQMRFYDDTDMLDFFRGCAAAGAPQGEPLRPFGRPPVPGSRAAWSGCLDVVSGDPLSSGGWGADLAAGDHPVPRGGWRTAAILYDLIPILNDAYASMRRQHQYYAAQLLRFDLILAISHHVETVFRGFLAEQLRLSASELEAAGTTIGTVVLPGVDGAFAGRSRAAASVPEAERDRILLLGTVEPRKRQTVVLQCYKELRDAGEMPLKLQVIGSLHGDVAVAFNALIAGDPDIMYRGYMPDADVEEAFARSRFTVFASADEGFGLPITESLSRGIPCLTADFGAMAEVAEGGGCLTVDVMDPEAICQGMRALATDDGLVSELREQIMRRAPRGWRDYARDLLALLTPSDGTARLAGGGLPGCSGECGGGRFRPWFACGDLRSWGRGGGVGAACVAGGVRGECGGDDRRGRPAACGSRAARRADRHG